LVDAEHTLIARVAKGAFGPNTAIGTVDCQPVRCDKLEIHRTARCEAYAVVLRATRFTALRHRVDLSRTTPVEDALEQDSERLESLLRADAEAELLRREGDPFEELLRSAECAVVPPDQQARLDSIWADTGGEDEKEEEEEQW
jgi:hypothetical protein